MNTRSVLLTGFCFICVVVAAALYAQNTDLQRQQAALSAELEALRQTAAVARAHAHEDEPREPLSQNDRMELMRLRNEVTQLRATAAAARDALKAALNNRPFSESQLAQNAQPGDENPHDHAPQEGETYDPLAFYRKNPELMKRYFPHLVNGEAQNQPSAPIQPANATETAPDVPADPLAFYRKNPELMKRYFPHLHQVEEQTAQESAPAQAPLPPDHP